MRNKKNYAVLIPARGKSRATKINLEGDILGQLQSAVGGYIEVVAKSDTDNLLIINENGKYDSLPFNPAATEYMIDSLMCGDIIVGDAVMVRADGEDFGYYDSEQAQGLAKLFDDFRAPVTFISGGVRDE